MCLPFSTVKIGHNEWIEIHWIDAKFGEGGTEVNVDGKTYVKMMYDYKLPEAGKRNGQITCRGNAYCAVLSCRASPSSVSSSAVPAQTDGSAY